jgi:hypothetical protein
LTLALGLVLLAAPAHARKKKHVSLPTWDWSLSLSEGAVYNDNVLGFSGRDRDAYSLSPSTFPTPLNSVDDMQNEFQIRPGIRWRAPLKLMVSGEYRFKTVNRAENSFSDYQTHWLGLSVRPRVAAYKWSASFRTFVIPSYYLRVYKDRDWGTWEPARFRNWDYEGAFRYRFYQPLWLEAKAAYGTYYYGRKFTEYDSDYREFSLGAAYESPWFVTLNAGFTRRLSTNVGKDQAGPVYNAPEDPSLIGDSEYGDADFRENEVNASVSSVVPWIKLRRVEAGLSYKFRRRAYISSRPLLLDPIHRGRLDKRWEISPTLNVNIIRSLDAAVYFTYEQRRVDSPDPRVPLVKDFTRHEYGLALTYMLK